MAVKTPSQTIISLEDPASLQTLLSSPTFTRSAPTASSTTVTDSGLASSPTVSASSATLNADGTSLVDTGGLFTTTTSDVAVVPVSDGTNQTTQNVSFTTGAQRSVVIAGISTDQTSTAIVDSVSVYNTDNSIYVTGVDQRTVQQYVYGGSDAYVLPPATTTTLGGVIADGTTIIVEANGMISASPGGYVLPTAGTGLLGDLGGVRVDGSTINIDGNGIISANGVVTSVDVSGGNTGLTTTGGPVQTSGVITLAGTLNVSHGGTGSASLTGYVYGNGTGAMTASNTISGTVITGDISGNAENVNGIVSITNGGTGANTKTAAFDALSPSTTAGDIIYYDGTNNVRLAVGSTDQVLTVTAGIPSWTTLSTSNGTVTDVTITTVNGFSGSVATSTTTPAISIGTTVTGLLKGDGSAVAAAISGTDYAPATTGTSVLAGDGSGGFNSIIIGTGLDYANGTLSTTGGTGTVTSVGLSGGTTGLSVTDSPITTSGTITLDGVLNVAHGGTGATSLTGYVYGNGTGAFTSSNTIAGSAITGDISGNAENVNGIVSITNGGTGANTKSAAFDSLSPSQTGNDGKILTTDGTTTSWTSLGVTNELFVSKGGNDSTGNGSITNSFLTISAALNYLNSNYPVTSGSGIPFVIVIGPGEYVENVTIDRLLTNLWGYEGKLKTTRISGTVTVTSAVDFGGLFQNNVSLNNLFIAEINNPAVQWTGNQPMSLDVTNCVLYTSGTGTPLLVNNTAIGGNRLRVSQTDINAIGNAPASNITNVTNGILTGINSGSAVTSGSAWRFTDSVVTGDSLQLTTSTASSLVSIAGATSVVNIGYSAFNSSAANSSGINISTAGARAIIGDCFYNVPLGTGYAVTGTAGAIYVRGGNQALPGTNNTVNPVLAPTTFTMSTHVSATDLIGTVAIANGGTGQSSKTAAFDALAPTTNQGDLIYYNGTDNIRLAIGSSNQVLTVSGNIPSWSNANVGTVTSVSISAANGFTGTVVNPTTTPAISIGTSVTGLLKGNGTSLAAAVSGTDYAPATTGASILAGNESGGFSAVSIGSGLSYANGTLTSIGGTGTVTSVGLSGGTTGLTVSNSPITTSGTITLDGTLAITHGGTGASTKGAAFDALAPTTTAGDIIYFDGTNNTRIPIGINAQVLTVSNGIPTWLAGGGEGYVLPTATTSTLGGVIIDGTTIVIEGGVISAVTGGTGTVTSVDISGGTTGLTTTGGPITSTGSITLGGTLNVANGGTGTTTSTGTGSVVLSSSPTLITPNLGTPSSINLANATGLPLSSGITGVLSIANGGTGANTATSAFDALAPTTTAGDLIYFNGTDNTRLPIGSNTQVLTVSNGIPTWVAGGDGYVLPTATTSTLGGVIVDGTTIVIEGGVISATASGTGTVTSVDISGGTTGLTTTGGPITSTGSITLGGTLNVANGGTGTTTSTGTGSVVLSSSPTLITPNLGTPSSINLTNATGLPISTGLSGLGAGVATFLATPTSANLANAVTDETGTGSLVFANSPTLITPNIGTPSTAILSNATGLPVSTGISGLATGIATFLAAPTSANLASAVTDETGTGSLVFANSPTLITPNLGTPSSINLTNATGLPVSTGLSGLGAGVATFLATPTSANLASAVTDETGTGSLVFANSPTLITPNIGTPSTAVLTNATGLPVSTGISGLGAGVATFLATPTSANLASAVTDETGTGSLVFANSPTLITPNLGTPSSINLTNATSLSLSTGITGVLSISNGGTGANTKVSAFDALAPTSTTGDMIYFNGTDNVRLGIGSNTQVLTVSGGIPSWSAASSTVPGGSNTQIQYNNNGTFSGISTVTYNGSALSLGSNSQVKITGGSSGQVLSTDGSGNLNWAAAPAPTGLIETVVFKYSAGGSGTFLVADPIYSQTSGVSATVTDGATCVVAFTFTGKTNPPKSIIMYGQVFNSNTFIIRSPIGPSSTSPTVLGGGTNTAPAIALGTFDATNTVSLQLRPQDTGATGAVGQRAWLVVVFGF